MHTRGTVASDSARNGPGGTRSWGVQWLRENCIRNNNNNNKKETLKFA